MSLKRTIAITAIGGSIVLGLSACGSSDTSSPATTPSASASSSPSAAAPAPSQSATPEPVADTSGMPTVEVAPGGLFVVNYPKGYAAAEAANPGNVGYKAEYDAALVAPAQPSDAPKTKEDYQSIVGAPIEATDGTALWKAVDGASGTTTVIVSYTNPKTGEVVSSNLAVVVK